MKANPVSWFEIYADNLQRAKSFYEKVFKIEFSEIPMPGELGSFQMLGFPGEDGRPNAMGALVYHDEMKAGKGGTVVYFNCEDCSEELSRVSEAGGTLIQEKMSLGEFGYSGIAEDTEGNMIGFHSMK